MNDELEIIWTKAPVAEYVVSGYFPCEAEAIRKIKLKS
jgi:hypothetical protein